MRTNYLWGRVPCWTSHFRRFSLLLFSLNVYTLARIELTDEESKYSLVHTALLHDGRALIVKFVFNFLTQASFIYYR